MARYEFRFIVTHPDLKLEASHQEKISAAVAQAGAMALADFDPPGSVNVRIAQNILWRGRPAVDILHNLEVDAAKQAGLE